MKTQIIKAGVGTVKALASKGQLKLKKYSPQILLGVGTIAILGGIVLACKETEELDGILTEAETKKEEAAGDKKATAKVVATTTVKVIKNYAPAAAAITGGFTCIFTGFGILNKRLIKTQAAYEVLSQSYKALKAKHPEDMVEKAKVEIDGEKGKKDVDLVPEDPNNYSPYARFFDELSTSWRKDPEYNMVFLKAQQNYANDLLHARGHLFLNEVYDMLGIPRSKEGSVVGWLMGHGDDFVDFGLYEGDRERVRAFVNGYERSILLDFNVDGLIYDKI